MSEETIYKAQAKAALAGRNLRPATIAIGAGVGLLVLTLSGAAAGLLAPVLVLGGIGAALMWPAYRQNQGETNNWSFLAGPGAMLITLGLTIFMLSLFNHEEAWGYMWTLLPISFITGLGYARRNDPDHPIHTKGKKAIRLFSWIAVGLGLFLELLVFQTFGPWWPLLIIGYGVYLLAKERKA